MRPVSIDSLMKKRLKGSKIHVIRETLCGVSIDSLMKKRLKGVKRTAIVKCDGCFN